MGKRLIGSVGLADSGVPDDLLTTKGDTHGFSSTNARIPIGDNDQVLTADSAEALGLKWATAKPTESFIIAASDESTALTTGSAKVSWRMPYAFTLKAGVNGLTASCNQAPTGAILTMDINESGTTIMNNVNKLQIAIGSTTSVGGVAPVLTDVDLAYNALMTVDIDQIGSSNAGTGLKITLIGVRA